MLKLQWMKINVDGCVASRCVQAAKMRVATERTLAAAATTCELGIKASTDWHHSPQLQWSIEGQLQPRFVCLLDFYSQEERRCVIDWLRKRQKKRYLALCLQPSFKKAACWWWLRKFARKLKQGGLRGRSLKRAMSLTQVSNQSGIAALCDIISSADYVLKDIWNYALTERHSLMT